MKWNIYLHADKNTHPKHICPLVVFDELTFDLMLCDFDEETNSFIDGDEVIYMYDKCYYAYIDTLPFQYKYDSENDTYFVEDIDVTTEV